MVGHFFEFIVFGWCFDMSGRDFYMARRPVIATYFKAFAKGRRVFSGRMTFYHVVAFGECDAFLDGVFVVSSSHGYVRRSKVIYRDIVGVFYNS